MFSFVRSWQLCNFPLAAVDWMSTGPSSFDLNVAEGVLELPEAKVGPTLELHVAFIVEGTVAWTESERNVWLGAADVGRA